MDKAVARAFKVLEIARSMAEKLDKERGSYGCGNRIDEIQLHVAGLADGAYAEPGYDGELAATGNWNEIDVYDRATNSRVTVSDLPRRVSNILEKLGFECEWSDEWTTCAHCQRLVRTSPDSYSWKRSYFSDENEGPVCQDCLLEDPEEYLRNLEDNPDVAVTFDVDPCDHGYNFTGKRVRDGMASRTERRSCEDCKGIARQGCVALHFQDR